MLAMSSVHDGRFKKGSEGLAPPPLNKLESQDKKVDLVM